MAASHWDAAGERDLWFYPAGACPVADAVMVTLPFTIADGEMDTLVGTLRQAVDAVARAS